MTRQQFANYLIDKTRAIRHFAVNVDFDRTASVLEREREIGEIISRLERIVIAGVNNMTDEDLNSPDKTFQAITNFDALLKELEHLALQRSLNINSFSRIFSKFCPRFPFC